MLFTTKRCPNCKAAKRFLDEAGILYRVVDAEEEKDLAGKYLIRQAPTLIVSSEEHIQKIGNLSNIKLATGMLGGPDNGGTRLWWDKKPYANP